MFIGHRGAWPACPWAAHLNLNCCTPFRPRSDPAQSQALVDQSVAIVTQDVLPSARLAHACAACVAELMSVMAAAARGRGHGRGGRGGGGGGLPTRSRSYGAPSGSGGSGGPPPPGPVQPGGQQNMPIYHRFMWRWPWQRGGWRLKSYKWEHELCQKEEVWRNVFTGALDRKV